MSKVTPRASKIYKPEILECPKCKGGLKYCYTISNKVIQFTSGKVFRIKNLGYMCFSCNDKRVYFSQTAHKLSIKGYTYSAKIFCIIDHYKSLLYSREKICDILASKGIEVSDRNVANMYKRFQEIVNQDYEEITREAIDRQLYEFNEIRFSIDQIVVEGKTYVIIYDFFSGEILSIFVIDSFEDEAINRYFEMFMTDDRITYIFTIRNIIGNKLIPFIKKYVKGNTKLLPFMKF